MRRAYLIRQPSTENGTLGTLKTDSGLVFKTIERPWVDNKPNVSSIPTGVYLCRWQWSGKHSCNLYHVTNVLNRDVIEIHSANVYQQLLGCISPGTDYAMFKRDSIRPGCPDRDMVGVTNSKTCLAQLEKDMRDKDGKQENFELEIS